MAWSLEKNKRKPPLQLNISTEKRPETQHNKRGEVDNQFPPTKKIPGLPLFFNLSNFQLKSSRVLVDLQVVEREAFIFGFIFAVRSEETLEGSNSKPLVSRGWSCSLNNYFSESKKEGNKGLNRRPQKRRTFFFLSLITKKVLRILATTVSYILRSFFSSIHVGLLSSTSHPVGRNKKWTTATITGHLVNDAIEWIAVFYVIICRSVATTSTLQRDWQIHNTFVRLSFVNATEETWQNWREHIESFATWNALVLISVWRSRLSQEICKRSVTNFSVWMEQLIMWMAASWLIKVY